jgi:hypothetical protein
LLGRKVLLGERGLGYGAEDSHIEMIRARIQYTESSLESKVGLYVKDVNVH